MPTITSCPKICYNKHRGSSMKCFIFLSLFILSLSSSLARSPAVEPVSGLSIDKYQHTDTKNQNFKKGSYKFSTNKNASQTFEHDSSKLITNPENSTISTYIFIAIALLLPAGLWVAVMYGIKDKTPSDRRSHGSDTQNVTRIHDRRGKESEDTDSDLPKAS